MVTDEWGEMSFTDSAMTAIQRINLTTSKLCFILLAWNVSDVVLNELEILG